MVGNKTERDELKTEGAAIVDAILVKEFMLKRLKPNERLLIS